MKSGAFRLAVCLSVTATVLPQQPNESVQAADRAKEVPPLQEATPSHKPWNKLSASFGYGSLEYQELSFEIRPGLESKFKEPVYEGNLGWEFFWGHHTLATDVDFFQTQTGTETWYDYGALVQQDDLNVWRLGLDVAYLFSSVDRSVSPSLLTGAGRWIRFRGGLSLYYRHEHFSRDNFLTYDPANPGNPPTQLDLSSHEKFDMVGAEAILELEAGPRDIAALFVRGRGGGGFVTVSNDAFGSLEEDARVNTAGVQGVIEAGLVSQPLEHLEIRLGYRYMRREVFEETTTVSGTLLVDLPDNRIEAHIGFISLSFPF